MVNKKNSDPLQGKNCTNSFFRKSYNWEHHQIHHTQMNACNSNKSGIKKDNFRFHC